MLSKAAVLLKNHRKDALGSWRRMLAAPAASAMTVAVVGLALTPPALLFALDANLGAALDALDGDARITLFLDADVADGRAAALGEELRAAAAVRAVRFISAEQALADFSAAAGFEDVLAGIGHNPLPAALVVTPEPAETGQAESLAGDFARLPEVESVLLDSQWLRRLRALAELVGLASGILLAAVLAALVLVVGNTVRLAIENRRDEIRVIKLIGGTDAFIARPFLYAGLVQGLLGGLLAALLVGLAELALRGPVQELARLYESGFRLRGLGPASSLGLVLAGGAAGWLAARLASWRNIAAIRP